MGNWYYPHKVWQKHLARVYAKRERDAWRLRRRIKIWKTGGEKRQYFCVEYQRIVTVDGKEWSYKSRSGMLFYKIEIIGLLPAARYLVDKTRAKVLQQIEEDLNAA